MQVPICRPSAEQILSPAVVQAVVEAVKSAGEEEGKEGAAAAEVVGTTATFSCTFTTGGSTAAAAAGDGAGCTAGDDACAGGLARSPEPPGMVQPMGVHWIPCTLPSPFGATLLNKLIVASMSSNAHPSRVSVTVVGLWIEICLLQKGLVLGFAPLFMRRWERATMASLSVLDIPQEPGEIMGVSKFRGNRMIMIGSMNECGRRDDDGR